MQMMFAIIRKVFEEVVVGNGFLRWAGLWSRIIQAIGRNLEALQAKFNSVVRETELKFLEAAIENSGSVEQWELLIHMQLLLSLRSFRGQSLPSLLRRTGFGIREV